MSPDTGSITANQMGRIFASDPEMSLPARPYFRSETFLLPYGEAGILIEGAHGTQVLSGRSARDIIPPLLAVLDGTRTLQQICELLPHLQQSTIFKALALLQSRGLLEDGSPETPAGTDGNLASFVGRFIDVTRVNKNRWEALERLRTCRVALVGEQKAVARLAADLQACSIDTVCCGDGRETIPDGTTLLVLLRDHNTWGMRAQRTCTPALRIAARGEHLEVGPLVIPGKSACLDCFNRIWPDLAEQTTPSEFSLSLVSLTIFHLAGRIGAERFYNRCAAYRGDGRSSWMEDHLSVRLPGCEVCGLQAYPAPADLTTCEPWLLHNSTLPPPLELVNPRDHQMHYTASNLKSAQMHSEAFVGGSSILLAELPHIADACLPDPSVAMDLRHVALCLRLAYGYQVRAPRHGQRIAPSAGGLGSAEAILINRSITGLAPGAYHYFGLEDRLDFLDHVPDELLAGALGIPVIRLSPAVLVNITSLVKLRPKYANAAFRLANADAGVAVQYLHETCNSLKSLLRSTGIFKMRPSLPWSAFPLLATDMYRLALWRLAHLEQQQALRSLLLPFWIDCSRSRHVPPYCLI